MYFEIKNVKVYYDKVYALKGISMNLEEGEIITIIGANGAGKTTTLKAICGIKEIAEGEIWFNGVRIDKLPPQDIVALGVVMVPEGRHVFPYMNVKDNLLMGAYHRKDKEQIYKDLERIQKHFPRLKEREKQKAGSLSGGEQQMVAIGRALMAAPKLLLMDEPSLGLSPILVKEIEKAVKIINKEEKVSVILVEQNAKMALRLSNRGYVMETGRIALEGKSEDLLNNEQVKKLYLGG